MKLHFEHYLNFKSRFSSIFMCSFDMKFCINIKIVAFCLFFRGKFALHHKR
eukprot:TRINITY_DN2225_c0_g1_i1.p2 TRINITY_DN2225_c0_g1~~TRINITY_DN2225_c0_g1_i1.p2  ORF type:complete len:51 (+),score=5.89 TRINITY_DN2225_c0_g1_i1:36-188(+)